MAVVTGINAIETSFVKDYGTNVELLVQQMGSKLRDTVEIHSFTGESAAFVEQVGEVAALKRTTRHSDTPLVPTPMDRRWVYPVDWEIADLIDQQDRLRQIIDPTSPFARAQAASIGRAMDDAIIEGVMGDVKTGKEAGTTVSLPGGQVIVNGGTAMTISKLRTAREKFLDANVDLDSEMVTAVITPRQLTQLLATTEVTSSDFNTVKALVQGELNTFMGFRFKVSNRLLGASSYGGDRAVIDTNVESALFYTQRAAVLGIWNDITARIDERADKSYATQVYAKATFGAARCQEPKVIRVDTLATA